MFLTLSEVGWVYAKFRGSHGYLVQLNLIAAQQLAKEIRERNGWFVRHRMATMATWRLPSKYLFLKGE